MAKKKQTDKMLLKDLVDGYRKKSKELFEENPELYVTPRTAMRRFWKRLKNAYLELVKEGKIDVTKDDMSDEARADMWTMILDRDIEIARKENPMFMRKSCN